MPESILEKKLRILGNATEGSPEVLRAVASKQWTAKDASEYRRAIGKTGRPSHAELVKATMRVPTRTVLK